MIEMINRRNGQKMYVAEHRVQEYLAAGHTLAAAPEDAPKEEKKVKACSTRRSRTSRTGSRKS